MADKEFKELLKNYTKTERTIMKKLFIIYEAIEIVSLIREIRISIDVFQRG